MKKNGLITLTPRGLYCERGAFYIDPWKPVERAVLTHAHADHTYRGNQKYLVSTESEPVSRIRLGDEALIETTDYGKTVSLNGVKVSLHPAGHILGSAQVRVEYKGETWVVSGDYKLSPDATCTPFEHIRCQNFITEATFGLPIYRWSEPKDVFAEINDWWRASAEAGKACVLFAYSLGKAQRVMSGLDRSIGNIFTHGAVERLTEAYRQAGVDLPQTTYTGSVENKKAFAGSLIIAPPSAQGSTWLRRFGTVTTGFASGWMMVRGSRRQRAVDRGFVLSDHADWPELLEAIEKSEADNVYVTHGFVPELVRWLQESGTNAEPLKTRFVGDAVVETIDQTQE